MKMVRLVLTLINFLCKMWIILSLMIFLFIYQWAIITVSMGQRSFLNSIILALLKL